MPAQRAPGKLTMHCAFFCLLVTPSHWVVCVLDLARQVLQICRNSFEATFAPEKEKLHYLAELDKCKAK